MKMLRIMSCSNEDGENPVISLFDLMPEEEKKEVDISAYQRMRTFAGATLDNGPCSKN